MFTTKADQYPKEQQLNKLVKEASSISVYGQ